MLPVRYRVTDRRAETADSATLWLEPVDEPLPAIEPGQFTMLYAYGVGEVPISVSGIEDDTLVHTIRAVGAVSRALHAARPGTVIGARGPFGTTWRVADAIGRDLVVVAGGIGLAPLRPVVVAALDLRPSFAGVTVVAGARAPEEFLFRDELDDWAKRDDLELRLTIDKPAPGWDGPVGFVTEPLAEVAVDPLRTVAFLCGPEPMMRFSANLLLRKGVPACRILVSLERNMKCGVGLCGHCQLGPALLCRDGPVVDYAYAEPLLSVKEL
ncbi:oxidoreductase [Kribbella sindirgiensis]|uniref:Oxidoreductase n=2 Tax=Kribbella sindirgiensis TaxID=1124744 RepID=A0A4R0I3R7_9ACTN|nr:oxidoreductase [Kribbella sindirgiensis]